MPTVIGYTDDEIFKIATKFASETNRVYIAEQLEAILADAQSKSLDFLADTRAASEDVCVHEWDEGSHNVFRCKKCGKFNC